MKSWGTLILFCLATSALADEPFFRTAFLQRCQLGTSLTGVPMLIGTYRVNDLTFDRYYPTSAGGCPETIAFD
ncbi:MAG: hypothetical protein GZ089_01655 [Aromatoleum sp.]|nr:hypothetical protein [Aromatoleum sp.]